MDTSEQAGMINGQMTFSDDPELKNHFTGLPSDETQSPVAVIPETNITHTEEIKKEATKVDPKKEQQRVLHLARNEKVHFSENGKAKEATLLDYIFDLFATQSEQNARTTMAHVVYGRIKEPAELELLATAIREDYLSDLRREYESAQEAEDQWESQNKNNYWNSNAESDLAQKRNEAWKRLEKATGLSYLIIETLEGMAKAIRAHESKK